jgi:hypothetical protein
MKNDQSKRPKLKVNLKFSSKKNTWSRIEDDDVEVSFTAKQEPSPKKTPLVSHPSSVEGEPTWINATVSLTKLPAKVRVIIVGKKVNKTP